MINTQLTSQIASTRKEIQNEVNTSKDKNKPTSKETLATALKQNLGLAKENLAKDIVENFTQNKSEEKLKELVSKLLEQIHSGKNFNSPVLQQGKDVNFAPNFTNELKILSTELAKNDIFSQILERLNQIIKPVSQMQTERFAPLLKNSGMFFETKLKEALNQEILPKSFYSLISTIKSLSNEKISNEISQLAFANLSPKESLNKLNDIVKNNKNENKHILDQSSLKSLLKFASKIENFKNYIHKNPSQAQEKIATIANTISKEINALKNEVLKTLNRPQNLIIENTKILNQSINALEKLENTIKNILQKQPSFQKPPTMKSEEKPQKHIATQASTEKTHTNEKISDTDTQTYKNEIHQEDDKQQKKSLQEMQKDSTNTKEQIKENKKDSPKEVNNKINESKNEHTIEKTHTQTAKNSAVSNPTANQFTQKEQEIPKENIPKNFAFSDGDLDFNEAQILSKDLSTLAKKLNQSLKELEPETQNAKLNLEELKHLNRKLELSFKDINQIKLKTENDIHAELQNDIKSTLLQISNIAKNEGNEAVYNQANRLLAQIELNQLLSLANDSVNTYLPFFWDDLNDSKIIFKRGKKDKFFTQIKLQFAKLGELEILLSLNNEKYIDINIMAENKDFRKNIYENAHKLKRAMNKVGLLSSNFFVGDIIRNKFEKRNLRNYDLEMGMDKKV
ncbi:flagellar hook-length control protein FliK [Campylobacter sp. MIT 21-1685]|uniref:flagellar hook-length control protein FliK n=1 Tax=unclassified Campylobacter TaxID=2593542 RepID=UPI00224B5AB3|nr:MULTISPECIES: flagellar hook-length control protein FliK [unclassified Campylobacter]MCX2682750.1 flagellar hook-length control protein FliK [Campylobacter sp. MIT 21-1684]MCX2751104.1 flagellar hook-length control protein FliK [Campylobacter sp. MIT 21-1682]MCX2807231.1 flagellar hook-length control protein FliK [Campylobacter sp. MIT 21-1685]